MQKHLYNRLGTKIPPFFLNVVYNSNKMLSVLLNKLHFMLIII